ncbi:DUF748 domain-containing protein [Dasania sp. GY-MA-18]|uniref:DUF748 domain-containing protein n=1 Tax=Dasania phycosphaerae TaxID=2950436 RepID=A0A9J6RQ27_9GAMM|nr:MULTISPECIES: DUF748 domain-containing protein [Dasania]MCR8923838.1 DUF748 domain-containing protein [Dasania sp. GY-MA-18]MCZ0866272.1 DUF748 domain-containing protein [Dasania phycosphaerae]MCZ0869996.1 DUF748 domain-containing protein [Dasania phycosphaerae]
MTIPAALRSKLSKLSLAVIIVLALLPELLRFALIQATPKMGWGELSIDDINLNLFTANIEIEQLALKQQGQPALTLKKLSLDLDWWQTLNGVVTIEAVAIDGLQAQLSQLSNGQWQLLIPPADTTATAKQTESALLLPALTLQQFKLSNSSLDVHGQTLTGKFSITQLQLQQFSTVHEQPLDLQITAAWNNAPITLAATGNIQSQQQQLVGTLTLQKLQLKDFAQLLDLDISALTQLNITFNTQRNQQGDISAEIDGTVVIEQAKARYRTLVLNNQQLQWQGKINLAKQADTINYNSSHNISISELQLINNSNQQALAQFKQLALKELTLDQNLATAATSLRLDNLQLLPQKDDKDAKFYNGLFLADSITYAPDRGLAIKQITINDSQYHALINDQGELAINPISQSLIADFNNAASTGSTNKPVAKTNDDNSRKPLAFAINNIMLGGESYLFFEDQRFQPSVKQKLQLKNLSIANITNHGTNQTAAINLDAAMGEFSQIQASGDMALFSTPASVNIKGTMEAIELTDISPYAESYLGYQFSKGQLDHKFTVALADQQLNASNKLTIRQLELQAAKKNKNPSIQRKLNIPLDMALNVLRDRNNNIELEIPIKGPVDKLGIGLSDIVNEALSNSLVSGATHYLKYTLQPYSSILLAAEYLGEKATSIKLQAMEFEPGKAELADNINDYAKKVVLLMQQRPQLSLSLCGSANAKDKTALASSHNNDESQVADTQLIQLAEQRSKAVKSIFIAQGISSKRLYVCQAGYKAKGQHGVLLSL